MQDVKVIEPPGAGPNLLGGRDLWRDPWADVASDHTLYDIHMDADIWVIPQKFLAVRRSANERSIDFSRAIPEGADLSSDFVISVKRRLKRIVRIVAESSIYSINVENERFRSLGPISICSQGKSLVKAANFVIQNNAWSRRESDCPDGSSLFSHHGVDFFQAVQASGGKFFLESSSRMNWLKRIGRLSDWPAPDVVLPSEYYGERRSRDGANLTVPFDDKELSKFLEAAIYLSSFSSISARLFVAMVAAEPKSRGQIFQEFIEANPALQQPLEFRFRLHRQTVALAIDGINRPLEFARRLLLLAQSANAALIAASTGMRPMELDALPRSCLNVAAAGIIDGFTFKSDGSTDGASRQWPIPAQAVQALQRQKQLSDIARPGEPNLWIDPPGEETSTTASRRLMAGFSGVLDRHGEPVLKVSASVYRLRTSMARLVALSVQGGPHAIMTVYGHKDIVETQGYYRARGDFEEELLEVMEAVSRALGDRLIEEAELGLLPEKTRRMVEITLDEIESVQENLDETNELPAENVGLSMRLAPLDRSLLLGNGVQMVKPGILCRTRRSGRGACATVSNERDPANCSSECTFRLEMFEALQNRDLTVKVRLAELVGLSKSEALKRADVLIELLSALHDFEGPLKKWLTDVRLKGALRSLADYEVPTLSSPHRRPYEQILGDG